MLCRPLSIRPIFRSVSKRTFSCVKPRSRRTAFNLSTTCCTNKSLRLCRFILQITAIMRSNFTTFLYRGGYFGHFRRYFALFISHKYQNKPPLPARGTADSRQNRIDIRPICTINSRNVHTGPQPHPPRSRPSFSIRDAYIPEGSTSGSGRTATMLSTTNFVKPRHGSAPKYSR